MWSMQANSWQKTSAIGSISTVGMGFMIGPQLAAGCIIANTIAPLLGALKP
jgi:hypothetical protein